MNPIIPFSPPFAVCKITMARGRKHPDVWAGHLADTSEKEVVWDSGPPTTYGPKSTEDQEFYSDACLVVDVANGKRLYQAVEGLMSPPPLPPPAVATKEEEQRVEKKKKEKKEKKGKEVGPVQPLDKAITDAAKYYGKKHPKKKRPVWLAWLEGCIRAATTTGELFHFCLCRPDQFARP